MAFNDPAYIETFRSTGAFPEIHADIAALVAPHCRGIQCVFDLGACTGLLSIALRRLGVQRVIGIEANSAAIALAPPEPGVELIRYRVDPDNLTGFRRLLKTHKPTIVVMRRCVPEISGEKATAKEAAARIGVLAQTLYDNGVDLVAIEGRVESVKSKHPLSSVDKEALCFRSYYAVVDQLKRCRLLRSMDC